MSDEDEGMVEEMMEEIDDADDSDTPSDPRWDELKKLTDNN